MSYIYAGGGARRASGPCTISHPQCWVEQSDSHVLFGRRGGECGRRRDIKGENVQSWEITDL